MKIVRYPSYFKEIPETDLDVERLRKEFPNWNGEAICFPNTPIPGPQSITESCEYTDPTRSIFPELTAASASDELAVQK